MRRVSLNLALLLLTSPSWAGEKWQLTIAHTNDMHGWMMPFDYRTTNPAMQYEVVDQRCAAANAGGLARRATLIARMRKTIAHPFALIDSGDTFTRGPWHTIHYGVPEIEAYNTMGYDMVCVGNNEFKATADVNSQTVLMGLVRQSRFPWLSANLTVGDTGVPVGGIHPFIVRRFGNVRVGFLGLTAPRSKDYPQTRGWTIGDPVATASQWVPIARKECDILIAVTHIGFDLDKQLAAQVAGIDAIIGGDSHTFLPAPVVVLAPDGARVPIVQAGAYGVRIGRLDMTFEKQGGWRLTQFAGKLIRIDDKVQEDPAIRQLLTHWIAPTAPAKLGLRPKASPTQRTRPVPSLRRLALRSAAATSAGTRHAGGSYTSMRRPTAGTR